MLRLHVGLALALVACTGWLPTIQASDGDAGPERVAGKTFEQYRQDLSSDHRVVRLRAIKSAGAFGTAAGPMLLDGLAHDDPAVRYTAAVHLGGLGGEPLADAQPKLQELSDTDSFHAVRMAVAYALCETGKMDEHLPTLVEMLDHGNRGTACSAAEFIGALGPDAKAAIEALEKTLEANRPGEGGDYHLGGAAANALRKVRGNAN